jgi:hypothetical protein
MADLVRRNSGGLIISDAGPGKDPASINFSTNPLQQWWGIEDVPQAIINQFHQKSLFPTQLILDEIAAPVVENGQIIVRGWIVGSLSFTNFQISKPESGSESSWQVQGKVIKFKKEAEVRRSSVPVDPVANKSDKPSATEVAQEERLGTAHTLPAQLRRMLLSVTAPTFYYSTIWLSEPYFPAQAGNTMSYQVPSVAINSTLLVAMYSEQKVHFAGGESKSVADKLMKSASWETKVVRASI